MDLPDYKALKKLADACRKAGIQSFKGFGFEFTLAPEAPVSNYKKKTSSYQPATSNDNITTDGLSEQELLFWSTGGMAESESSNKFE